jgi:hypothetical protein
MHYVLEVQTLFYRDMLIHIWQVIKIVGGAPEVCFYCRWNNSKLDFKNKKVVALSTTEAEYVVATEASKEMIWLQRFMEELGKK